MNALEELKFCLKLWKEQGGCEFGGGRKCVECGAPYLLWKMVSGEVLHGSEQKSLSREEWENKVSHLKILMK